MRYRNLIFLLTFILGGILSWLLVNDMAKQDRERKTVKDISTPAKINSVQPKSNRKDSQIDLSDLSNALQAIPGERIVQFSSKESYQDFLKKLGNSRVRLLGKIDQLYALRLGFDKLSDLDGLELDSDDLAFNYPVFIPSAPPIEDQGGVVGFDRTALEYLGISVDNSTWGHGVTIAVVDTGIEPHLALNKSILSINLAELEDGVSPHSHGTSVASLIAGNHPNLMGVAPGADLISIRVADQNGSSSSFLLAQGIMEASLNGAQIINISMGSNHNSPIINNAIQFAIENGAVIVASPGNDGLSEAASPARHPDVISVGAVDALGQHLNFSHTDENLSASAPGLQITAAYPGDKITEFSGTSASAPFFSGAIAAVMSESNSPISAQEAVDILLATTNEAGAAGADAVYGNGILDVGRAINRNTAGITDLAVAAHQYVLPSENQDNPGLQISVENRGTEAVWGSTLAVSIAGGQYPVQMNVLQPNERKVITLPIGFSQFEQEGLLEVQSTITLSGNQADMKESNNQRTEQITHPNNGL